MHVFSNHRYIVLLALLGLAGCDSSDTGEGPIPPSNPFDVYELRVSGFGVYPANEAIMIDYLDEEGVVQRLLQEPLPWVQTVSFSDDEMVELYLQARVQAPGRVAGVEIAVIFDGKIIESRHEEGSNSTNIVTNDIEITIP